MFFGFRTFSLGLTSLLIGGCGASRSNHSSPVPISSSLDSFSINSDAEPLSFPTATISVDHCASGYFLSSGILQQLRLYRDDHDCVVSLLSISDGVNTFHGRPLSGPAGTSGVFKSEKSEIFVTITRMISNPVKDDDQITYAISSVADSSQKPDVLSLKRGPSGRIRSRASFGKVPYFSIKKIAVQGVDAKSRSFLVRMELECYQSIRFAQNANLVRCSRLQLSDIRYKLVADRYQSRPSLVTLNQIFKAGATRVHPNTDLLLPTENFNGGFTTKQGLDSLKTPAHTASNSAMLLILESPWGFQYFNLDFQTGWTSNQ